MDSPSSAGTSSVILTRALPGAELRQHTRVAFTGDQRFQDPPGADPGHVATANSWDRQVADNARAATVFQWLIVGADI